MMSLRAWLALLLFYVIYLLIGGFTFKAIEAPNDCENAEKNFNKSLRIYRKIEDIKGELNSAQNDLLEKLLMEINSSEVEAALLMDDVTTRGNCTEQKITWNFFNSLFFSFTAITTIGFGHLSPGTDLGKVICIVYSLLGVPINGILIGSLGAFFGGKLKNFVKERSRPAEASFSYYLVLTFQVMVYLIVGCIIFMAFPAIIFASVEKQWNYLDAFYFAFITLTTIGFGDYVAGRDQNTLDEMGGFKYVYLVFTVVWIIFGLGYVFMIIGVITDGLKAPAKKAAKKLAKAEKAVIAKVLQEIVLIKSKQAEAAAITEGKKKSSKKTEDAADSSQLPPSISKGFENAAYNPSPLRTTSDAQTEDLVEEVNHDTITSLRHFVETAQYVKSSMNGGSRKSGQSCTENQTASALPTPSSSRAASIHGGEGDELRGKWKKIVPRKLSLRSVSSQMPTHDIEEQTQSILAGLSMYAKKEKKQRKISASLPEILRETTLEEFLEAVERVKAGDILTELYDDKANIVKTQEFEDEEEEKIDPEKNV